MKMSLSRLVEPFGRNPKSVNEIMILLRSELLGTQENRSVIQTWFSRLLPFDSHKNINRLLKTIREIIYGSIQSEPESEKTRAQVCEELNKTDLLSTLIEKLPTIGFDCMKDIALIYEYAISHQVGTRLPTVEYIVAKPEVVQLLVKYYGREDMVSTVGQIIRECLRFESLTECFFKLTDDNHNKLYFNFLDFAKSDSFFVSSDVFSTLHHLFFRHKTLAKGVIDKDYDQFLAKLNQLLISDNYYVRRKSIKLLTEILLDRNHQKVMKKFIASPSNAQTIHKITSSDCIHTSFDGFLVFNLFVINPNKSSEVIQWLTKNKVTLIEFFDKFQMNEQKEKQYKDEKQEMIEIISKL